MLHDVSCCYNTTAVCAEIGPAVPNELRGTSTCCHVIASLTRLPSARARVYLSLTREPQRESGRDSWIPECRVTPHRAWAERALDTIPRRRSERAHRLDAYIFGSCNGGIVLREICRGTDGYRSLSSKPVEVSILPHEGRVPNLKRGARGITV